MHKPIRRLLKHGMYMTCRYVNNKPIHVFNDIVVTKTLGDLHTRYLIVQAENASNNGVVCKTYFFSCLERKLDLDVDMATSTNKQTAFSKDEMLANHRSAMSSFAIDTNR